MKLNAQHYECELQIKCNKYDIEKHHNKKIHQII